MNKNNSTALTIREACRILRKRVRFDSATLHLPGGDHMQNDAEAIQRATQLYVETWIVPLLDCIETGDLKTLHRYCLNERGLPLGSLHPVLQRELSQAMATAQDEAL